MGRKRIYEKEAKTTLRFPEQHRDLADGAAKRDARSLNFWIAKAVEERLIREGLLPDSEKKKGGK